jgi:two-component system, OmpR family, sensor histidine kinase SenX3
VEALAISTRLSRMQIISRSKAITFFIALCSLLVAVAITLNVSWIMQWRGVVPLVLGIVLFALIIAGLIFNTIFLVREIRRNAQHDSFVNAVTHELRTPITSIRLYLETLQSRDVAEDQRRDFYRIMHADTERLITTVDQVLRAAEATHKHSERNWTRVDMSVLLHECVEAARLRYNLGAEQLAEAASSLPMMAASVRGDAEELRVAITNLLDNAVKYADGAIKIFASVSTPGNEVLVRISDAGVGIPHTELKRIFKRFYRAGRARTTVKGTGLGLFIVRSILKKHRGDVFAESEGEGKGARITLRLPRYVPE